VATGTNPLPLTPRMAGSAATTGDILVRFVDVFEEFARGSTECEQLFGHAIAEMAGGNSTMRWTTRALGGAPVVATVLGSDTGAAGADPKLKFPRGSASQRPPIFPPAHPTTERNLSRPVRQLLMRI
jgi:hypothetical protein